MFSTLEQMQVPNWIRPGVNLTILLSVHLHTTQFLFVFLYNIYFWYIIFINYAVCVLIFMTSPLGVAFGLLSILRRFIYKFLNVCPFDYTAVAGSGKVTVVTPTDCPKSVRNCCLIELFCGVVCVVTLPLWYFCWYRGFCHRTGSDLLLFVFN